MQISLRRLKREVGFFIVGGLISVIIDFIVYFFAAPFLGTFLGKIVGYYSGVIFSFIFNRYVTFGKNLNFDERKTGNHIARYTILLTFTMLINSCINEILYLNLETSHKFAISFVIATGISMNLNFIFMKYWVFK